MGKMVVVVGSTGVGKTTLTRLLCRETGLLESMEQHKERPFQAFFKSDPRYAFPNQIDYLLYRMEQEITIRTGLRNGIMDGGLELDYYGFTRLFVHKGWMNEDEYGLCQRFFTQVRELLPPPDIIIYLFARPEVIEKRLEKRDRLNIASYQDIELLDTYIREWLATVDQNITISLDVSEEDLLYNNQLPSISREIQNRLG